MEGKDLTKGNLLKNMVFLIIPLFLTNLLNSIYSIVDGIWIGRLIGGSGVSVITNCYPLTYIVTSISSGLAIATSVMVSQHYGAKENEKLKSVVGVAYFVTFLIGSIVSLFMIITASLWLKLLNTPQEILNVTKQYLTIYMIGSVFNYILTVIMEALRAIGNSRVPLVFVVISTIINLILDPILIYFGLGITGTAIATLIAMSTGTIIAIIYVNKKSTLLKIDFGYFKFNWKIITRFLKTGIPITVGNWFLAIMHMLEVNVSNSTGLIGNAGYGVAGKKGTLNSRENDVEETEVDSTHAVYKCNSCHKFTIYVDRNSLKCEWIDQDSTYRVFWDKYSIECVRGNDGNIILNSDSHARVGYKELSQDELFIKLIRKNLLSFGTLDLNSIGNYSVEANIRNEGKPGYILKYKPYEVEGVYFALKSFQSGPLDKNSTGYPDSIQFLIYKNRTCSLSYCKSNGPRLIGEQQYDLTDSIPSSVEFDLKKLNNLINFTLDNGVTFREDDEYSKALYEGIQLYLDKQPTE